MAHAYWKVTLSIKIHEIYHEIKVRKKETRLFVQYFKKEANLSSELILVRIQPVELTVEGSTRGRFTPVSPQRDRVNEQARETRENETKGARDRKRVAELAVHETALTPPWLATLDLRSASR